MRRLLAPACVLLGCALVCVSMPGVAVNAEEAEIPRLTEKERKSRLSRLRAAALRYVTQRKRFPSRCPVCQGSGIYVVGAGRSARRTKCPQCDGMRAWLSKKAYRAVYYDMRSPAFRRIPDIKEILGRQYDAARHGKPWPKKIARHRMRERELVDDTHGIVWFLYDAAKVPTATYWIWAREPEGKKSRWYLYDSRADGPWPEKVDEGADSWAPLEPGESAPLRRAIANAHVTFRAFEYMKRGETLLLRMKPRIDKKGRPPDQRVGTDAVRLARSVFSATSGWTVLWTEWHTRWQDDYKRIRLKATWIARIDKNKHDRTLWNTRTLEQQMALLDWETLKRDGWTGLDRGGSPLPFERVARPQPAQPEPQQPAPQPTEPEPTEPEPSEPTEPEPERPPPTEPPPPQRPPPARPTPQPPAAPPSTEPQSFEVPDLTSSAKRRARKGIARMKALFEQAKAAHDDGVIAHRGGAHDLWQEKLAEARGHLGEIEEAWNEDVVAHMPGRDEGIQEDVANEHFGEIWDDIYKLKAMVRKMSTLR